MRPRMNEARLARAIRRALLLSLAVPTGAVVACGGTTMADLTGDSGSNGDAEVNQADGDTAGDASDIHDGAVPFDAQLGDAIVTHPDASAADSGSDAYY